MNFSILATTFYSNVLKVDDVLNKKTFVVKQYKEEDIQIREILNLKFLSVTPHKYLVQGSVINFNQRISIQMSYYEGGSLRNCRTLNEQNIKRMILQIGSAIAFLHNSNILHRDIKPENILLTKANIDISDFALCDFASSKYQTSELSYIKSDITTELYQAPEIFNAQPYSMQTDAWAFGCCIYEMQHGRMLLDSIRRREPIIMNSMQMNRHLTSIDDDLYYSILQKLCRIINLSDSDLAFIEKFNKIRIENKLPYVKIYINSIKNTANSFLRLNPADRSIPSAKFNPAIDANMNSQISLEQRNKIWQLPVIYNFDEHIEAERIRHVFLQLKNENGFQIPQIVMEFIQKIYYYYITNLNVADIDRHKYLISAIVIGVLYYIPNWESDSGSTIESLNLGISDFIDIFSICIFNVPPFF